MAKDLIILINSHSKESRSFAKIFAADDQVLQVIDWYKDEEARGAFIKKHTGRVSAFPSVYRVSDQVMKIKPINLDLDENI